VERRKALKKILAAGVLLTLVIAASPANSRGQAPPSDQPTKEVQMTAKAFEFSPSTVEVNAGTLIIFKITSLDRTHGFEIDGVKNSCVKIEKGQTVSVEYRAEKPGEVVFRCCVFCGGGHAGMKGKIVIR
jgi:heme/copper-type cytochrome/quinol oxidase subunit 2